MTEKSVSKAFLLAALIIITLAPVFFYADSSIRGTAASKAHAVDSAEQGIRKQENATSPVWTTWKREQPKPEQENNTEPKETPGTDETERNREPKEETGPFQHQDTEAAIDAIIMPAPSGNSPGLGISTNRVDLSVYSDSACTQPGTSMNLGSISPGESVNTTLYVKNTGTNTLRLSLQTKNWKPTEANGPVTLTWNLEDAELTVNQVSTATLTLNVSSTIQGITTFSFDVVISGTE